MVVPNPNTDACTYANAVSKYLANGGDINARHEHEQRGLTMLMHASSHGFIDVVNLLITRGASLDLQAGSNQYTALMYAMRAGQHAVVSELLRAGAATRVKDALGRTALLQCRSPESMALGDGIYYMCVPSTENVRRCVDILRRHIGLPALSDEEREHRVEQNAATAVGDSPKGEVGVSRTIGPCGEPANRSATTEESTTRHSCATCGGRGTHRCGRCKIVWYCSRDCQQTAWIDHKRICAPPVS